MTRNELIEEIEACRNLGSVQLTYRIPTVAVQRGTEEFFFQGEEAIAMLTEAEKFPEVSVGDYILWLARGW